jgi:2-keto-4-pentenoate hydratase/2-oxohepta-3-ene-1,7-dioic acid hydratase in catechol pathway
LRLCRYDENRLGVVRDGVVHDVTGVLERLPAVRYPLPGFDPLIAALAELRPHIEAAADRAAPVPVANVALLSPVASPGKIVGAPVNYLKHLAEAELDPSIHHNAQIKRIHEAGLFLKATSSLIGPSQRVVIRHHDRRNDHEVELVAVIGRRADRVPAERALEHVAAYAIGLDMTTRGTEERSLRKSIDSYSVLGPWLVTADELADPGILDLRLSVDGEPRQSANTREMVLDLSQLIALASSFYTLMPGDLLYTGTPEGVGPVMPGSTIEASITGIGAMRVQVT